MSYLSLYRRYRPQDFNDIVGQDHVVKTLQNAITNDRLVHAYIFSGPRGTGKTSMARILAKTLNCRKGKNSNPCNLCDLCLAITEGSSIDVNEIDAASNRGIDEIRQLRERINFAPVDGLYKVYIIDEVHMLTTEAFNALLKTLEEPPKHVIFVMATTEPQKIPETIISRCQRLDFVRLDINKIKERLLFIASQENMEIDDKVLSKVARDAEGGMRDAISLLDQLYSYAGLKITIDDFFTVVGTAETEVLFDIVNYIINKDTLKILKIVSKIIENGKNIQQVVKELLSHLRYLLFAKLGSDTVIDLTEENIQSLKEQAGQLSLGDLQHIIMVISRVDSQMRWYQNARLLLEIALIELSTDSDKEKQPFKNNVIEKKDKESPKVLEAKKSDYLKIDKEEKKTVGDNLQIAEKKKMEDESTIKLTIADIKHKWPVVLNNIKNKKITTYTLICDGFPIKLENDNLIIGFKRGFSFHKEKLKSPENEKIVKEVIKEVFNNVLSIDTVIEDNNEKVNKEQFAEDSNFDQEVLDLFSGKVVK